jgi:hypothetical protein
VRDRVKGLGLARVKARVRVRVYRIGVRVRVLYVRYRLHESQWGIFTNIKKSMQYCQTKAKGQQFEFIFVLIMFYR